MIGFLVASIVLATMIFAIVQFAFLWVGRNAVETAAHFAARRFAINARADIANAKNSALYEAVSLCRNRIGGNWESAAMTSLNFAPNGENASPRSAAAGDAYRIRLTHGVELVVPWINRILFLVAPIPKARFGDRYYLFLQATRWVTVE